MPRRAPSLLIPFRQEYFSNFVHRDEAFELIYYLWKHPVVYVAVETSNSVGSMVESSSYRGPTAPMPSSGGANSGPPSIWQQQAAAGKNPPSAADSGA